MPPRDAPLNRKLPTGIEGLDEITRGGLPLQRTTLLVGGPGCGKTVLALQVLVNGARMFDEAAIFVSFEESPETLLRNAESFGWGLRTLAKRKLFFVDGRPRATDHSAGDFDLAGLLSAIAAKAGRMRAKRIVFDSLDVLLNILEKPEHAKREMYRLHEWLTESGLTAIITGKADEPDSQHRYAFYQYMVDCAILLKHAVTDQIARRELRILKFRGSGFSENAFPMVITPTGVQVAFIGQRQQAVRVSTQRVGTGVRRLDVMLSGGPFKGSSVLITGASGTCKSTLCSSFLAAACKRGERALYVSFDEGESEHIRNMASVGIRLQRYIATGRLQILSVRSGSSSLEDHLVRIQMAVGEHRPDFVAFDPLSSLMRSGGLKNVQSVAERLLHMTKARGITTVCTSLLGTADSRAEGTPLEVSTIADTWIHLSYAVQSGERNRALTVVKSRGTPHSHQVRELLISHRGLTLADVYTSEGEVLMGTMRWQREAADAAETARRKRESHQKHRALKLAEAELQYRVATLQRELESKRAELQAESHELTVQDNRARARRDGLLRQRRHGAMDT